MAEDQTTGRAALFEAVLYRWRTLASAAVLAVLAFGGALVWRAIGDRVAADPRYRVTADSIETTPPPAWVRTDVRAEVLSGPALRDGLSALGPPGKLERRLADAFRSHPWVRSVSQIRKQPPNRLSIELEYRTPLAAVGEASRPGGLLPVDAEAVRLPAGDLSTAELRHLPRITLPPSAGPLAANPQLGEAWADPRVIGAVKIVTGLGGAWWDLGLVDVIPSSGAVVRGGYRRFSFELVSTGGTRVAWGAAPGDEAPGEPLFADKLHRLITHAKTDAPLRGPRASSRIDLRSFPARVEPRISKKDSEDAGVRR